LPVSSSGAVEQEATEVLEVAFEDFFVVIRTNVELVGVEDAEVRQPFIIDEHVLRL
jgi:hypothetical protein